MAEVSWQVPSGAQAYHIVHSYEARPEWWQLPASVTSILLMTTVLEELRPLLFICFPTTVFFSVSALNEIKGKRKLLWVHDKKEHGLYFLKLMK